MVEVDGIGGTISNLGSGALNIGITLIVVLVAVGVIIGFMMLMKNAKKFKQFKVIIYAKDTFGQIKQEYDVAGIFIDKTTRNKRLFLKKNAVGLNPDSIPYISDGKGIKTIYLYKKGLKNFQFIHVSVNKETDAIRTNVGEEDVNWAVNSYERAKKAFTQTILMQYLPFIVLAFVSIVILIMFLYFFQQFSVLKELGVALKEASQALGSGTTIIPATP